MLRETIDNMPTNKEQEKKVKVDGMWMPESMVEGHLKSEEKRNEQKEKLRNQLLEAKNSGEKEYLDIEKVLRAFHYGEINEEIVKKMAKDTDLIEGLEISYYLRAPENVKTTHDYILWRDEIASHGEN